MAKYARSPDGTYRRELEALIALQQLYTLKRDAYETLNRINGVGARVGGPDAPDLCAHLLREIETGIAAIAKSVDEIYEREEHE